MNSLLKSALGRLLANRGVKTKFLLVGLWNTAFGYALFILLNNFFSSLFSSGFRAYMPAMIAAQVLSTINAYIFHKYVTFRSGVKGKGMIMEFLRFCTTYIVTFGLSLIFLPVFIEFFHMTPKVSAACVILVCTVISYAGHSLFSFGSSKYA